MFNQNGRGGVFIDGTCSDITFIGGGASGNGGNGVTIEAGAKRILFDGFHANDNAGDGIKIQGADKTALLQNLRELSEELATINSLDLEPLRALVGECEHEANKPAPNKSRLASFMNTVKSIAVGAIEITPKISAMIEAAKTSIASLKDM